MFERSFIINFLFSKIIFFLHILHAHMYSKTLSVCFLFILFIIEKHQKQHAISFVFVFFFHKVCCGGVENED